MWTHTADRKGVKIFGIGHDIVDHSELVSSLSQEIVLERLFAPEEMAYCNSQGADRVACFARRFAAKEAVIKALGEPSASLREISLLKSNSGKPTVQWNRLAELGLEAWVSISSSGQYSSATAIIVGQDERPEGRS